MALVLVLKNYTTNTTGNNMNKLIAILSLFFLLFLSSCAVGWHKQGVSDFETENALAQCEYEAGKDHVERGDFVSNCMKRQGFRWY